MPTTLLEADFLTFDLKSIINRTNSSTQTDEPVSAEQPSGAGNESSDAAKKATQKKSPTFDWAGDLNRRLEDNNKLSPESRETVDAIEKRFWYEFFTSNWQADIAKYLDDELGDRLKKDIKALGFTKKTNVIISFLKLPYVQKTLLQTKLLNSSTYKALRLAIAKRLMPESEFTKVSDYNIIYCADLYTKRPAIIEAYLDQQNKIIGHDSGSITQETQIRNKRAFFKVGNLSGKSLEDLVNAQLNAPVERLPSARGKNTRLNDIKVVEGITKEKSHVAARGPASIDSGALATLAGKLTSPEHIFAACQFFAMTANNKKASEALKEPKLANVSISKLTNATAAISKVFSNKNIKERDINGFIEAMLANLK